MPNIFAYTDYRRFLKDFYDDRKARDTRFSHRYISRKIGYKSTAFLSEVISGKKNLTGAVQMRLAAVLGLKRDEEEYFLNLVGFNQAKSADERNRYYEKLMNLTQVDAKVLEADKFEYFNNWYYAAIRELLAFHPFTGDYQALARTLNPPIAPGQARQAVKVLLELGLLREEPDGTYRPTTAILTTSPGFTALNVANFQRAFIDLAKEGLERHPREERDYSTLTMPLSQAHLGRASQAVAKLRTYLLGLSSRGEPDRIYQFNFQLFPLSVRPRKP